MADGGDDSLSIEIAFAEPAHQYLETVTLPAGAVVADAIELAATRPEFDAAQGLPVGVWGHRVDPDTPLKDGDRVEFYRPLRMDPREARRRYAAAGVTMNAPGGKQA